MSSHDAEAVLADLSGWTIHRPDQAGILRAVSLQRHNKISWRDDLIINSALDLGCLVLWSEDLKHGQRFGRVTVRNPFLV